ncbi:CD302 antigen isoform 2-T2 [Pholidichthys leucotaenia]
MCCLRPATVRKQVGGQAAAPVIAFFLFWSVMESWRKSGRSRPLLVCLFVLCFHLRLAWTGDCPADGRTWVPFGNGCYHFVHGDEDKVKSYTLERAKTICLGFELLTVQSAEENDFIINYSPEVWKGSVPVNLWLGIYYDPTSKDLKWATEEPVRYTNWEDSFSVSDLAPMDTCVALHSNSGKWENVSCSADVENGVICEAAQQEKARQKSNALISAIVILSVVAIVGVSAVIWFLHQKHNFGSIILTAFEYHPPFRVLETDQSCLVETEETNSAP